ncbi:helix-turn-helix domain-containing protein [Mangrovihabitans endophyticus]|uniref:AraC family transcriptional regulator n=1 Tax=Mangrovihabitans endophyticus TaxID=1751298 RepID=A0A8J3BWP3_9ACTN|nr:AraC family transcriptional regulator [Mangrovihabitans endophyticus]GGK84212.1 AraC family transcriptional regulator [Mangrovihabitans endophyticus]
MLTLDQRHRAAALPLPAPLWAGVGTCALPDTALADPRTPPQRLPNHLLALTTTGHGVIEIDFTSRECRPGTLLWVRPGQAVKVAEGTGLDAAMVCWRPGLLPPGQTAGLDTDDPVGPGRWQLTGEDEDAVINEFAQLAVDCERHSAGEAAAALLRHQLAVLLLRITLIAADDLPDMSTVESRTFARFRRMLEEGHATSRRVEDYAAQVGCSVRTLTRASLAVTGRTAKQVVDDRVALEARRLLACTPLSVAEVGRRLGFAEPTNFGRFFHREVGASPGVFRTNATSDGRHVPVPRVPPDDRRDPLAGARHTA